MKYRKSALPMALLGLVLFFSACATNPGSEDFPPCPKENCLKD